MAANSGHVSLDVEGARVQPVPFTPRYNAFYDKSVSNFLPII